MISGEKPKLSKAFRTLLDVSSDWKNIGVLLEIQSNSLDGIEVDERDNNSRLRAMLTEWLKQVNPPPTWKQLAEAVEPFNKDMAKTIKNSCIDHDMPL